MVGHWSAIDRRDTLTPVPTPTINGNQCPSMPIKANQICASMMYIGAKDD